MIDLKKITINNFLSGIDKLLDKPQVGFYKLATLNITDKQKKIIDTATDLKMMVNEDRGVTEFEHFKRKNPKQIELKGILGEYMFGKLLLIILNNDKPENIDVFTPPIAEMLLNKKKQDFEAFVYSDKYKQKVIDYKTFDIKSQFLHNDNNNLNININAFKRMKKQSKFFIYAEIDGKQSDLYSNNNVTFYYVNVDWYEKNSIEILTSTSKNFSPHRSLPLKIFH